MILKNNPQYVEINNMLYSDQKTSEYGIPQGTVLYPVLLCTRKRDFLSVLVETK